MARGEIMKKKIVLNVEVEMIIDEEAYPPGQRSNEEIEKLELENWPQWILETDIKKETVTVTDYPDGLVTDYPDGKY
jgi:hypothetical protein